MEKIKQLDFFGTNLKFRIFDKSSYQTLFGAFLSLCCFVCVVVTTILFGSDFYLKENPRITIEKVINNEAILRTLDNKNMSLAYRLEHSDGSTFQEEGKLHYNIYYTQFIFDKISDTSSFKQTVLKKKKCTDLEDVMPEFKDTFYYSENFYCVDFSSISENALDDKYRNGEEELEKDKIEIGGYFGKSVVNYLRIAFSMCDHEGKNCYDLKDTNKELKKTLYTNVIIQKMIFSPNENETPLKIYYENLSNLLGIGTSLGHKLSYSINNLYDDVGIIFKDEKIISKYAFNNVDFEISVQSEENFIPEVYLIDIFFNDSEEKINRSFLKLQELAATVGGFIKIIVFMCQIIIFPYNYYWMNLNTINFIFDNDTGEAISGETKTKANIKTLNNNSIFGLNNSSVNNYNNSPYVKSKFRNNNEAINDSLSKFNLNSSNIIKTNNTNNNLIQNNNNTNNNTNTNNNNNNNTNTNTNNNKTQTNKHLHHLFRLNATEFNNKLTTYKLNNKCGKIKLSYCSYLFSFINKKRYKDNIFKKVEKRLFSMIDITTYLTNLNKINIIRKVVFNDEQNCILDINNKIKTSEFEQEKSKVEIKKDIINYYKKINNDNKISDIDNLLINHMDRDIVDMI